MFASRILFCCTCSVIAPAAEADEKNVPAWPAVVREGTICPKLF
jgi:hypothetical protein